MSYCIKCGKPNPVTAKFCTGCGGNLTVANSPSVIKSKSNYRIVVIAILLAISVASYFLFFNKINSTTTPTSISNTIDEEAIKTLKDLVGQWNKGLNNGNASEVASLYAERLVYYKQQMSKGNAQDKLQNFLMKNSAFNQQINGEINIEQVSDNLVVCNFNKLVTNNGTTTDYPSYLKFSQQGTFWKIVEEGDKITDYNINKNK